MLLRDLSLVDKRREGHIANDFERFAIQIVELYLSHVYKKIKTHCTIKVVIQLVPTGSIREPTEIGNDVIFLDWPFDFDTASTVDTVTRKRLILDQLHAGLKWLANRRGWEQQALDAAYKNSIASDIVFRGMIMNRWVRHPTLPVAANCEFEFDADKVHVHVILHNSNGTELGRKYAYWTPVREDVVRRLLDHIEWHGRGKHHVKTFPGKTSWGEESHVVDVGEFLDQIPLRQ